MTAAAHLDAIPVDLENAAPQTILRWGLETYGKSLAVVTSLQPTGIAMLHMLHEMGARLAVLTLDTSLLFPESYEQMEAVEQRFGLKLVRVRPGLSLEQQAARYGAGLWQDDPGLCCHLRKVEPLGEALRPFAAWVAGLRRDQQGRAGIKAVSQEARYGKIKLCPCANWTEARIWAYIHHHNLPYNPLHQRGYRSIGCAPCTQPVTPWSADRAGRWVGHARLECGLHTAPDSTAE
jgi:phosphoadenosine phosphosulfate reductase